MGQLWPLVGRDEEMQMVTSALDDGGVGAVVLSGEAGVGKTRLAREALRVAAGAGMVVCWSEATEQTRSIPLGAVAHILPEPPFGVRSLDGFERLSWAVRSVAALGQGAQRGLVVAIDDAHHLDDVTAALLQQLLAGGWATVLTTVRADSMPDWLKALCQRDDGTHIPLQRLAQTEVQELLTRCLGGPIDAGTRVSLWRWSRGSALVLRELVAAGIEGGALQRRDGVWVWDESFALPARVTSLIESRLKALDDTERAAMEILAVGEALSPAVLAELHLTGVVAGLEGKGLVESTGGYKRSEIRLRVSHPLYGEVLRSRLPSRRTEAIQVQLASALETLGAMGGDDVLRVALWRLSSGSQPRPELLVEAARQVSWADPRLAEQLSLQAREADNSDTDALQALGHAVLQQGRMSEAEALLTPLLSLPPEDYARVEAALDLAFIRYWNDGDSQGADALLSDVEQADTPVAAYAASLRAAICLWEGRTEEVLESASHVLLRPDPEPIGLLRASLSAVAAMGVLGRTKAAIALAERCFALRASETLRDVPLVEVMAFAGAELSSGYAQALRWACRVDEAIAHADSHLHRVLSEPGNDKMTQALATATLGRAQLGAGHVRPALDTLRAAALRMRESDILGFIVWCLADLATAAALAGDYQAAEEAIEEAAARVRPTFHIFDAELARARSVVAASRGELSAARARAMEGAALAQRWRQPIEEAECLHQLVRLGNAKNVRSRLAELAQETDSGLVRIFAEHAAGSEASDGAALDRVADSYAAAGAGLLAVEAGTAAAGAYRRAGLVAAAARTAARCRSWWAACPGAPALDFADEAVPLTSREQEVVMLAGRGATNNAIAAKLVVSVRTVESHLQHAYTKLGVHSRAELTELFGG